LRDVDLPIAVLREMFDVDLTAGTLTWRARPRDHFVSDKGWRIQHKVWAGRDAARTKSVRGYRRVKGRHRGEPLSMEAHRVIWALANGRWPTHTIDHIRGVGAGDGIDNLREATQREQNEASGGWSGRLVGTRPRPSGKWEARIRSGRKLIHLGTFDTEEGAHTAYLEAKKVHHSFQLAVYG
jgi:HNH endonuclease/AP2 domain